MFVIPPGFCYVIAEFPIAYCCIWHGSCLGTLHSVAFSRVLREYPVGVRVLRRGKCSQVRIGNNILGDFEQ